MRCHVVRSWTFSGLVAAFLDLSVAFSLLCASSLLYLTSKLLGLFGLSLPCPCDGLFSDPRKNKCFQEGLVNLPVKKISSVQRCVRKRTPFDSVLYKEANVGGKKRKGERKDVELEREVSCTPSVKEVENASGFELLTSQSLKKGSFKIKSKRLSFHRSPYGLKNHSQSSLGSKNGIEENDQSLHVNSTDSREALEEVSFQKSVSLSSIGGTFSSPVGLTYSGVAPRKPIEILEQVLVEERAARAALALELEKERNAAASAADEALGMILLTEPLDEIFTSQMDSSVLALGDYDNAQSPKPREVENDEEMNVNGIDQDSELDQTRSEGLLINIESECTSFPDIDCHVHDIHIVTDEDEKVLLNVPCDHVTRGLKLDRSQSVSDTGYILGPACPQGQRNMSPTMRRNSMSAVDCERLRIESEVGLLRGRLRAVQKGRENLSFFSKEQSKSQIQRIGDKTSRFWPLESSSPSPSTMVKVMSMTLDLHSA